MKILITIIVPVYNAEKSLEKCVKSIIKQTVSDWECILVDDGSIDNSGLLCDEFAKQDRRIKVVHKKNGGVGSARNEGIARSVGTYIIFVDSDDFLDDSYLASFFKKGPVDEKSLIIQGCTCISGTGSVTYKISEGVYSKKDVSKAIAEKELFKHGSPYGKLYVSNVVQSNAIRFDENIHNYEDLLFLLDYLKYVDNVVFFDDVGYHYLVSDVGLHCRLFSPSQEVRLYNEYNRKISFWEKRKESSEYLLVLAFRYFKALYRVQPDNCHEISSFFCQNHEIKFLKGIYLSRKERILFLLLKINWLYAFNFFMKKKYYHYGTV